MISMKRLTFIAAACMLVRSVTGRGGDRDGDLPVPTSEQNPRCQVCSQPSGDVRYDAAANQSVCNPCWATLKYHQPRNANTRDQLGSEVGTARKSA